MVPAQSAFRPPPAQQQQQQSIHQYHHRHLYHNESAKPPLSGDTSAARLPAPVITSIGQEKSVFCPYNLPFPDPFLHGDDKFVAALPAQHKIPREDRLARSQIRPGWHEDASRVGGLYNDSSVFVKHRKHGCISLLYERQLRQRGSHGYSLTLVDGHISASDGVGFVFAGRVPCSKNIKRLWSVFANRAGHVVKRMGPRLIRSDTAVLPPLTVGMTVSMVVDLNQYCATFEASVFGSGGSSTEERQVLGRYHVDFTDIAERVDCSQGYLCAAVTRAGIAAHLDSFSPEILGLPAVPAVFAKRAVLMCKQALAIVSKEGGDEAAAANAASSPAQPPLSTYLPAFSSASTILPQDFDCPTTVSPTDGGTPSHWLGVTTAAAAAATYGNTPAVAPNIVVCGPSNDVAGVAKDGEAVDLVRTATDQSLLSLSKLVPSSPSEPDHSTFDHKFSTASADVAASPQWPLISTTSESATVVQPNASSCSCCRASSSGTRLAAHSTAVCSESHLAAALLAAGRAFSEPSVVHDYRRSGEAAFHDLLGTSMFTGADSFAAAAGADVFATTALLLQQQQALAFSQLSVDGSHWDSQPPPAASIEDSTSALAAALSGGGPLQRQLLEELFALQQLSQQNPFGGGFLLGDGSFAAARTAALTSGLERSETYYHGDRGSNSYAAPDRLPTGISTQDVLQTSPLLSGGGSVDVGCLSRYRHQYIPYHSLSGADALDDDDPHCQPQQRKPFS